MELSIYNADTRIYSALHGVVHNGFRRKVAIVGGGKTRTAAPFDSYDWEIWACNSMWSICRDKAGCFRADRWFEMHPMSVQTPEEMKAIHNCPVPLYTLERLEQDECPNSVRYPLEQIMGRFKRPYFNNTIAYQIALAIHEQFSTIGLFGIDMDGTSREAICEKACVEYWIGIALGAGIQVDLPKGSSLATQEYLYGYNYHEEVKEVDGIKDRAVGMYMREMQVEAHVKGIK